MIIFDASPLIAIFNGIKRPDVFEDISKLDDKLVITEYVFLELRDPNTITSVKKLLQESKIELLNKNTIDEIQKFRIGVKKIQNGEADVILTYQKLKFKNNVYCILDDYDARRVATLLNIKYTGLLGLLQKLGDEKIKSPDEINEIVTLLKRSTFRIPEEFTIKL